MHIIAIISRKGGTGKTTLACSLAVAAQTDGFAAVDIVFIDTAPQVAGAATQAVQAADYALAPCRPGLLDLAAIASSLAIAQEARVPAAVVLNAARIRSPLVVQAQGALLDGGATVAPVVYQRIAHAHAYAITAGQAAAEREPASKAAVEIRALWEWLCKCLQPQRRRK